MLLFNDMFAEEASSINDSSSKLFQIEKKFKTRTTIGMYLSIGGLALNFAGFSLPFIMDSSQMEQHALGIFGSSLGMIMVGSTTSSIGSSIIYRWAIDHVKDLPETNTWKYYKFGSACMYTGFIITIAGILASNSAYTNSNASFGVLVFFGGEALLLVSSFKSAWYCSKVAIDRHKNKYQYFVVPSITIDGRCGLTFNVIY
jgi:hypothetical protein